MKKGEYLESRFDCLFFDNKQFNLFSGGKNSMNDNIATVSVVCDWCGRTFSVKVLPYYGTPMREYQNAQIGTECKCGGVFRPVTRDGIKCPNELFTVEEIVNSDDEVECEMQMYCTLSGHNPPVFGSFFDAEEALSIVKLIESGDENAYFSYAEASRVAKEIRAEQ